MYEWLNGPGKVFRSPLPNSTNYLSAYDKQGNLLRTRDQRNSRSSVRVGRDEDLASQEEAEGGEEEVQKDPNTIPRERQADLRPYPLNRDFRAQTVLSEELRNVLYKQVVEDGIDITTVSAVNNVDTRRVAAVVRLKTIENQWIKEVSLSLFCPVRLPMMITKTNRLVLKTSNMVTQQCFASLSDRSHQRAHSLCRLRFQYFD